MKKSITLGLLTILATVGLAACGGNADDNSGASSATPTPSTSSEAPTSSSDGSLTKAEVDTIVAGYDKALDTTVSVTFKNTYTLDVDQASMASFEEDVDDDVVIEADFTAGSLYLYGKNTAKDDSFSEVLVYKTDSGYEYLTSTSADASALADEAAALAKIYELIEDLTYHKAGYIHQSTFLYSGNYAWEHTEYLNGSTNVTADYLEGEVSWKGSAEALVVTANPTYAGYATDAGISELSKEGGALTATTNVDSKGRVTSYDVTFNSPTLTMPITTPAPVLTLTGSRSFDATYGGTITKKTTIEHAAAFGTVNYTAPDATKGSFVVMTCAPMGFTSMTAVENGGQVQVGHWICVKPTAATGYTVQSVLHNNSGTTLADPAQANGFYCFTAVEGANNISVAFVAA